jgi:hypothetical protein
MKKAREVIDAFERGDLALPDDEIRGERH